MVLKFQIFLENAMVGLHDIDAIHKSGTENFFSSPLTCKIALFAIYTTTGQYEVLLQEKSALTTVKCKYIMISMASAILTRHFSFNFFKKLYLQDLL